MIRIPIRTLIPTLLLLSGVSHGQTRLFATNVPAVNGWNREAQAQGNPGGLFCDSSPTDYAVNPSPSSTSDWLIADDFDSFSLLPGEGVLNVNVDIGARFRFQPPTTGTIEWRVRWQNPDGSFSANTIQSKQVTSPNQNCSYRLGTDGDITDLTTWTVQRINSIRLRVRRQSGSATGSDLRVKAFRIEITTGPDCDGNGIADSRDLAMGAPDCNNNQVIDSCEPLYRDCDGNGVWDICDPGYRDCNGNNIWDVCEPLYNDCDGNGRWDICDPGYRDCNNNNIWDNCEPGYRDCNNNDIWDNCEDGYADCNGNGVWDICDPGYKDCNGDGVWDNCESGYVDCNGNGCADSCDVAPGGTSLDCNANGIPDECEPDCNMNGIPDDCDLANGTSSDLDGDGIPDECGDCNGNGIPDGQDVLNGAPDCNANMIPDDCDIAANRSEDCNADGIPDECQQLADCNRNGLADACEIALDPSLDCDADGVLDSCSIAADPTRDCDADGLLDVCQIAGDPSLDINLDGRIDCCGCFVATRCVATPNSVSALGGRIAAGGTPCVSVNQFRLEATGVPADTFGVYFFGDSLLTPPYPPVGNGVLCVGGQQIQRLAPAVPTGPGGTPTLSLDLTTLPIATLGQWDTRYFQLWYRDSVGSGFNTTNALEVRFCL